MKGGTKMNKQGIKRAGLAFGALVVGIWIVGNVGDRMTSTVLVGAPQASQQQQGTFMQGCEMLQQLSWDLGHPQLQTPIAVCNEIRKKDAGECSRAIDLSTKMTLGIQPDGQLPTEIGLRINSLCTTIVSGKY